MALTQMWVTVDNLFNDTTWNFENVDWLVFKFKLGASHKVCESAC
jgi:hypothetical protein